MALRCLQCGMSIRRDSKRSVFLFYRPLDVQEWVCGSKCYNKYSEGEDVSETPVYKVGDHMPDGREVRELDEHGKVLVVGPLPAVPKPEPVHAVEVPTVEPEPKPKPAKRAAAAKAPNAGKQFNQAAVAEKLAAAKAHVEVQEPIASDPTKEDDEMSKPKSKSKKAKTSKVKAAPKAKQSGGRKSNKWTDELKAKCRAGLKAGTVTYASIAKDMGVTPQTVWATLNRKK